MNDEEYITKSLDEIIEKLPTIHSPGEKFHHEERYQHLTKLLRSYRSPKADGYDTWYNNYLMERPKI